MVAARPALLLLAALLLSSCTQLAGAYRAYDAAFEREIVAGHDDARGDYFEYRWKPRRAGGGDTAATGAGKEVLSGRDGRAPFAQPSTLIPQLP
jgi:hypothetical protein